MLRFFLYTMLLLPTAIWVNSCTHTMHFSDPLRFEQDIVRFKKSDLDAMPPVGAIVCTGSSSIFFWHDTIRQDLAPLTVIPRGFGGSTYYDLYHYLDRVVLAYSPRAVMIYEGDNDIAEGVPPREILKVFRKIVRRIHEALPETHIYVLSIKPSGSRWVLWPVMRMTNGLLENECAKDPRLTWIDVATPLLDETGKPRNELYHEDQLHLNRAGYNLWRDAVRPVLIGGELADE